MVTLPRIRTAVPLAGPLRGLVGREVLAAAPALTALLVLHLWVVFLPSIWYAAFGTAWRPPEPGIVQISLVAILVTAFFLVGVLCGAEEEENGTAAFVRQLPVHPLRALGEKIAGSLLALAVWFAAAWILSTIVLLGSRTGSLHYTLLGPALTWGALFFSFGLAAGAWIRRVIPAAFIGGVLAAGYGWTGLAMSGSQSLRQGLEYNTFSIPIVLIGCAAALLAAAWRVTHPEGIPAAGWCVRSHEGSERRNAPVINLRWKEWTTRRWLTGGLALLLLAAPWPVIWLFEAMFFRGVDQLAGSLTVLLLALPFAVALESALLWQKEEDERPRCWLYVLPIPNSAILRAKLGALAGRVGILFAAAVVSAAFLAVTVHTEAAPEAGIARVLGMTGLLVLTGLPALMLFAGTIRLYSRSPIVTVIASALYIPVAGLLFADFILRSYEIGFGFLEWGALWPWLLRHLVLTAALGAWLFWLHGRSLVHEYGMGARLGGALLYIACIYVGTVTFLFAGYRELLFVLFGI